jgi:hypothetical protein
VVLEKAGEDSWNNHVRNAILHRVNEERNILNTRKRRKANWIGHILRTSCLLKYVTERKDRGKDRSDGTTRNKM